MDRQKILVVDDEADVVEGIRYRLEQAGYEVHAAVNGWEAIGAVKCLRPDLVILDVMLPRENGYRVAKIIKEDEPTGGKCMPVILLTGCYLKEEPASEKTSIDFSHADEVVFKPFDMDELLKSVAWLLARAKEG